MSERQVGYNDGKAWSEMDVEDLKASLQHGTSIEEAAEHLCREGTLDEVKRKADELGLTYHSQPPEPPPPMHKITKAEVVEEDGVWGVYFEFDDGEAGIIDATSRQEAEFRARDRVGDELPVGSHPFLIPAKKLPSLYARERGGRSEQGSGSGGAASTGTSRTD